MNDTTTRQVRFRRDEHDSTDGPRWIVLVDGAAIGTVEQRRVSHDHGSRKSRVATRRTYSNRWFAEGCGLGWEDTRKRAAAKLIEKALNVTFWEALDIADTGRNETKAERAARSSDTT